MTTGMIVKWKTSPALYPLFLVAKQRKIMKINGMTAKHGVCHVSFLHGLPRIAVLALDTPAFS